MHFDIGRTYLNDNIFDNRAGSDVFSATYSKATLVGFCYDKNDNICGVTKLDQPDIDDKAISIEKYTDESYQRLYIDQCADDKITKQRFNNSH